MSFDKIIFKNIMTANTGASTLSRLWMVGYKNDAPIAKQGICWILEDGPQVGAKVKGETRIPEGIFPVKPTRNSKFYLDYSKDKNLKLQYILHITNVPEFELIRVHAGRDKDDTLGCTLTGLATDMDVSRNFVVSRSREALKRVHNVTDPYFDLPKMDFTIPVFWQNIRIPLIDLVLE